MILWFLFSIAEAAQKKGLSVPLMETSGGGEVSLTFNDILQMKVMWLIMILTFFAKQIWDWHQKRGDRTQETLEELVNTVNRLEEKVDQIEKSHVDESQVKRLAREEIEFVQRIRKESQKN